MHNDMVIGIDIGGTHIRAALVDNQGRILQSEKIATEIHLGADHTNDRLIEQCRGLMKAAAGMGGRVAAAGLGVAGKIDRLGGRVVFSPNLQSMKDYPLALNLERSIGVPVILENDANVFGVGEDWVGAGRDIRNWIGVTLGTGVGGCLIFQSEVWPGDDLGAVAEIGHMVVVPGGPLCNCGLKGCLEAHSSGRALREGVAEAVAQGTLTGGPLYDRWRSGGLEPKDVYDAALLGDPTARRLFDRMGWALGLALANLFTVLGIRHAIIGGGLSAGWDQFIRPLHESLKDHLSMLRPSDMVILRSKLLDDAALLGAAQLAYKAVTAPK